MGDLKIGILGPIEAWHGGRRLTLGGPRQLALLAFLVLHASRPVSSDALIEGVWGGDADGAAKRLSMAIARLRGALEPLTADGEPLLRTVRGGYLLSVGPDDVDAGRFEAQLREGLAALDAGEIAVAAARLRSALALWRGPALAETRFLDFAQAEIERLEELQLVTLEARIDADLRLGVDEGLAGELGSLLARHPTRERLAGQLMLALYRSGRQAEALAVYQRTRTHLNRELGLEPGPELRSLEAQILEHAPAIAPGLAGERASLTARHLVGGEVTMVIAQLDSSSVPLEGLGELYDTVLTRLRELLHGVWASYAGVQIADRADGVLGVFTSPRAALEAALEARDAPARTQWPGGAKVEVRIAVHTGRLRISGGGYWGEDIHYAARLADAAHAGQVLVSAATAALAPDATVVDLGEHRLSDFSIPRRVFSLGPGPHPAPRTGDPLRSNLPSTLGELIGRDVERAELGAALRSGRNRLVSITGPGGSGKTRLALAVAEAIVDVLADGAFFVTLAQVSEPGAVAAAIAAPLGISLPAGDEQGEAIGLALSDRKLLLVLDNFEHLLGAAPLVADLLARAPQLRIMITSQAPLRIRGERVLPLGPLELPLADDQASVAAAAASRLLIARARDADPRFALTAGNAETIARLCRALDGLPLAIELAAGRLSLLSPAELLGRMDQGIEVVGRGSRDLPPRQRGLRAALDWTFGLLDADQATLLRRLGVFAGPVALARIERVCAGAVDLLESLAQLVDISLVTRTGDGRFVLHAAVRGYAREKLIVAGEGEELARRHAEALADTAELWGSRFLFDCAEVQSAVLREEDDIAQALTWSAASDHDCFARVAGGVAMPLLLTARLPPWSEMIEDALAGDGIGGRSRAWLLLAASLAAFQRDDVHLTHARLASTILAAEQAGDPWLTGLLRTCSIVFDVLAGTTEGIRQDYSLLEAQVAELHDPQFASLVEGLEPYVLGYCERRYAEAGALWASLIADPARTDFAGWTALYCLPDCSLLEGDYQAALDGFRAALRGARVRARPPTVAYQLEGITMSLSGLGRHDEALEAAGWAASVRQTAGPAVNSWYKELFDSALGRSRAAVGPERAAAAYARGRSLTLDAAVNSALEIDQVATGP